MRKNNPAVYECPKGKGALHTWERWGEGARCTKCFLGLTAADAAEVFEGEVLGTADKRGLMNMAEKFWIERKDDEHIEFFVGEKSVGCVNHDEHGWTGMTTAERLFEKVASAIGATVEQRYVP